MNTDEQRLAFRNELVKAANAVIGKFVFDTEQDCGLKFWDRFGPHWYGEHGVHFAMQELADFIKTVYNPWTSEDAAAGAKIEQSLKAIEDIDSMTRITMRRQKPLPTDRMARARLSLKAILEITDAYWRLITSKEETPEEEKNANEFEGFSTLGDELESFADFVKDMADDCYDLY